MKIYLLEHRIATQVPARDLTFGLRSHHGLQPLRIGRAQIFNGILGYALLLEDGKQGSQLGQGQFVGLFRSPSKPVPQCYFDTDVRGKFSLSQSAPVVLVGQEDQFPNSSSVGVVLPRNSSTRAAAMFGSSFAMLSLVHGTSLMSHVFMQVSISVER